MPEQIKCVTGLDSRYTTVPQETFVPRDRTTTEIASSYILEAIEEQNRMREELRTARAELAILKAKLRELGSE